MRIRPSRKKPMHDLSTIPKMHYYSIIWLLLYQSRSYWSTKESKWKKAKSLNNWNVWPERAILLTKNVRFIDQKDKSSWFKDVQNFFTIIHIEILSKLSEIHELSSIRGIWSFNFDLFSRILFNFFFRIITLRKVVSIPTRESLVLFLFLASNINQTPSAKKKKNLTLNKIEFCSLKTFSMGIFE